MNELTAPREEIISRLKGLLNYDEIAAGPHFEPWLATVFSGGMLGFDNIEVYELVKGRKAEWTELDGINNECKGVVAGLRMPESYSLNEVNKMFEKLAEKASADTVILLQARHHAGEMEMHILMVK